MWWYNFFFTALGVQLSVFGALKFVIKIQLNENGVREPLTRFSYVPQRLCSGCIMPHRQWGTHARTHERVNFSKGSSKSNQSKATAKARKKQTNPKRRSHRIGCVVPESDRKNRAHGGHLARRKNGGENNNLKLPPPI